MSELIKKRGRPEGMRAAQLDIQRRLIEHPDRAKVVEAVYRIALDDEHKHQAAAMKLLMDRMLPISICDKNADIRENVTITISSVEIPDHEEKVIN